MLAKRYLLSLVCVLSALFQAPVAAADTATESVDSVVAGSPVHRSFAVNTFRYIHFQGPGNLQVKQGTPGPLMASYTPVAATGDLPAADLWLESVDDVLYVDSTRLAGSGLRLQVTVADLREIYILGPGNVQVSGLQTSRLFIEGHGPGVIQARGLQVADLVVAGHGHTSFALSGAATHQTVELSGNSVYRAPDLATRTSQLRVHGRGLVHVWVDELLDVNISGAGHVVYDGSPWISQQVYGAGAIRQR